MHWACSAELPMQILHTQEPQNRNWEESVQRRYFKTWNKSINKREAWDRAQDQIPHGTVLHKHSIGPWTWTFWIENHKNSASDSSTSDGRFAASGSISLPTSLGSLYCPLVRSRRSFQRSQANRKNHEGAKEIPVPDREVPRIQGVGMGNIAANGCSLEKICDTSWAHSRHHFKSHSQTEWVMIEAEGEPIIIKQALMKSTLLFWMRDSKHNPRYQWWCLKCCDGWWLAIKRRKGWRFTVSQGWLIFVAEDRIRTTGPDRDLRQELGWCSESPPRLFNFWEPWLFSTVKWKWCKGGYTFLGGIF